MALPPPDEDRCEAAFLTDGDIDEPRRCPHVAVYRVERPFSHVEQRVCGLHLPPLAARMAGHAIVYGLAQERAGAPGRVESSVAQESDAKFWRRFEE